MTSLSVCFPVFQPVLHWSNTCQTKIFSVYFSQTQPEAIFPDWMISPVYRKEVNQMEDSRIIELYFQRNEEAISRTAVKYGNYCFSIAHNILHSREDAQEAVNDTYLGTWNAIPPHRPRSFPAFLGKITRRISINRYLAARTDKRGGGETTLALEELSACLPAPGTVEQVLEEKVLVELLNRFVRELPETEQKVFVLRYWYLDSIKDIAARFGFSTSKVKSMLLRTRKKLRTELEKEGIPV